MMAGAPAASQDYLEHGSYEFGLLQQMKGGLYTTRVHSPMLTSSSVSSDEFCGMVCVRLWTQLSGHCPP